MEKLEQMFFLKVYLKRKFMNLERLKILDCLLNQVMLKKLKNNSSQLFLIILPLLESLLRYIFIVLFKKMESMADIISILRIFYKF